MTFDPKADAAYVYLVGHIAAGEATSTRIAGIDLDRASINVDFDDDGKALGIEILGASRVLRRSTLDNAGDPPPVAGALLSVNRSIWGMVTPNLRGVCCQLTDTSLRARFMYADEPGEWTLEEVSCAEAECIADFWQTHEVSYVAEHLPPERSRNLMPGEQWVYLRYEASEG